MDSQQILLPQATAIENWTQLIHTAIIRSGCPATWTAYPSKALNVTWTPSSTRPSWTVELWTLISTPRLQLMGFLRGWSPLHTAGCRARNNSRWERRLLWRQSDSITKIPLVCSIDEHLYSHTQVVYSQHQRLQLETGMKPTTENIITANVIWHISSNSRIWSKGLKPNNIFCLKLE